MQKKPWIDQNGNYRCESCGKIVLQQEMQWETGLGYCQACYKEILEEKRNQLNRIRSPQSESYRL